jgi:hypothetical protein
VILRSVDAHQVQLDGEQVPRIGLVRQPARLRGYGRLWGGLLLCRPSPPPQEASAVAARTNVVTVRDRTARLLTLRSFFVEGREPSPPRLVCQIATPVSWPVWGRSVSPKGTIFGTFSKSSRRTSENPLRARFAERPFRALG